MANISTLLKNRRRDIGFSVKDVLEKLKAHGIDISDKTLYGWESGYRQPDADTFLVLCEIYEINSLTQINDTKTAPAYTAEALSIAKKYDALDEWGRDAVKGLVNIEYTRCTALESEEEQEDNCIYLPLSEQPASAGTGTYLGPEAFTPIKVIANEKTRRADFCVRVQGDSMEPIYFDGDIVMISKERPGYNGIGLVTLDGCGYIKRMGMGVLESENKKYAPIPLDESVVVNGRAVGILHPDWIIK